MVTLAPDPNADTAPTWAGATSPAVWLVASHIDRLEITPAGDLIATVHHGHREEAPAPTAVHTLPATRIGTDRYHIDRWRLTAPLLTHLSFAALEIAPSGDEAE